MDFNFFFKLNYKFIKNFNNIIKISLVKSTFDIIEFVK